MLSSRIEIRALLAVSIWLLSIPTSLCEPAPLALDFVHEQRKASNNALSKRGSIATNLYGTEDAFYVNMSIGTPPQNMQFLIDTNIGDTIAMSKGFPGCNQPSADCEDRGTYNNNTSSSFKYLTSNFSTAIGTDTSATGDYATDDVTISNSTISALQFGVVVQGNITDNILGIGYIDLESDPATYANLPIRLLNDGKINVNGYSIWFNHVNTTTGRLLLGGVDTSKFIGALQTIPFVQQQLAYAHDTIQLNGMSMTAGSNTTNVTGSKLQVIADTRTSSFVFPQAVVDQVAQNLGAKDGGNGTLIKRYSELTNDTTLDLQFGAVTISVPVSDMVFPYNETYAGISVNHDVSYNIIGVPFFRNAYAIFDFSHNQLSLAPINRKDNSHNVTAIGPNGAAGLVGVSMNEGSGNNSGSGGLSTGAKAGIGVGVAVGVLALIGLGVAFFFWRKKKKNAVHAVESVKDNEAVNSPVESNFGKAELSPISAVNAEKAQPTSELESSNQRPPAELDSTLAKTYPSAPIELPGDGPRMGELPTNANQPDGSSSSPRLSSGNEVSTGTGTDRSLISP